MPNVEAEVAFVSEVHGELLKPVTIPEVLDVEAGTVFASEDAAESRPTRSFTTLLTSLCKAAAESGVEASLDAAPLVSRAASSATWFVPNCPFACN